MIIAVQLLVIAVRKKRASMDAKTGGTTNFSNPSIRQISAISGLLTCNLWGRYLHELLKISA